VSGHLNAKCGWKALSPSSFLPSRVFQNRGTTQVFLKLKVFMPEVKFYLGKRSAYVHKASILTLNNKPVRERQLALLDTVAWFVTNSKATFCLRQLEMESV
jgi:hypothetical protein